MAGSLVKWRNRSNNVTLLCKHGSELLDDGVSTVDVPLVEVPLRRWKLLAGVIETAMVPGVSQHTQLLFR